MKAWIAGASGTIGAAVAKRFKELDYNVFTDRVEVLDYDAVRDTADVVRPDILINCTGVYAENPVHLGSVLNWMKVLNVNLTGAFHLTRAVLPYMLERNLGKIIHLSGGGAAYGKPLCSAYASSKAGLVRFVECVALETQQNNVYINAVAPGPVKSRMNPTAENSPDKVVELITHLVNSEITGRLISVYDDYRKSFSEDACKLRRMPL